MRRLKDIFAANLAMLMERHPILNSAEAVAAAAKWPRGNKAGESLGARNVDYARKQGNIGPSPTLDFVEAIARAFNIEPWELITEPGETRKRILERLLDAGRENKQSITTVHISREAARMAESGMPTDAQEYDASNARAGRDRKSETRGRRDTKKQTQETASLAVAGDNTVRRPPATKRGKAKK